MTWPTLFTRSIERNSTLEQGAHHAEEVLYPGTDQTKQLKELERENAKLKRVVAELSLEKQVSEGLGLGKILVPARRKAAVAAPLITIQKITAAAKPYPLGPDDEARLVDALPDHLAQMARYKRNYGVREQEVCGLRWDWEVPVPELKTSVFLIPGPAVKNRDGLIHVINDIAHAVIEAQRTKCPAQHLELCASRAQGECDCAYNLMFTYRSYRMKSM